MIIFFWWIEYLEEYVGVERECGYEIDEVDGRLQELAFVGADDEANGDFQREPYVAAQLHVEECIVRI